MKSDAYHLYSFEINKIASGPVLRLDVVVIEILWKT